MKKWTSALAMFVATAMLATTVYAQTGGGAAGAPGAAGAAGAAGGSGAGSSPGGTEKPAEQGGKATTQPTGPSASHGTMAADYSGRHTMEGEVTKLDQKKGHVTLKTAEGNMDLHFPPSALQNVKRGDRISVELAIKPMGSAAGGVSTPAASPRTNDMKKSDTGEKKPEKR